MFRIRELFQACMFYCYISNVCVFSKRLLLLLTYMRIYTKRAQETLRDFEEAKKQSALKRARFLNCSLVVFVFFVLCFIMCSSVSLSRVLLLSFASLAQEYYYYYYLRTPSLLGRADSTELIKTVFSP